MHFTRAGEGTREAERVFPVRTQQMAVVKSPTVGVETFLQSSGKWRLRRQGVVDRDDGHVELLRPSPQVILARE